MRRREGDGKREGEGWATDVEIKRRGLGKRKVKIKRRV